MASFHSVCIGFSGLTLRFLIPSPVALPREFLDLQCTDTGNVDAQYEIRLLTEPLRPESPPVYDQADITIFPTEKGWLRVYSPLTAKDGCQVACLLCPDHHNILYYPASRWDFYAAPLRCFHLIAGEALLLKNNAFLLHSSVVLYEGRTVLFSGPSGAGKSTQANLWARHLGARVLNGDRCVVMKRDDIFYGGGSPWSGTSGIYRREQAPIAGICLVQQALENSLVPLGRAAFAPLFTQTIVNSWDEDFMRKLTGLFSDLLVSVPVYRLNCKPDEDAVRLVRDTFY